MFRILLLSAVLVSFSIVCTQAQPQQVLIYQKLFAAADSINNLHQPYRADSATLHLADSLNHLHPAGYFETAGKLFQSGDFNNASFVYYLGVVRYSYFNAVNPKYQPSGNGALAASMEYVLGEPLNLFLKTNIDHFQSVLQYAADYHREHDYAFCKRSKDTVRYRQTGEVLELMASDMHINREQYEKEWKEERDQLKKGMAAMLEEYEKLYPEEKARLKQDQQQ